MMHFEEKVKFLRKLPAFMVIPEAELRAIAYPATEKPKPQADDFVLGETENGVLTLTAGDIEKIVRNYPDLSEKFK